MSNKLRGFTLSIALASALSGCATEQRQPYISERITVGKDTIHYKETRNDDGTADAHMFFKENGDFVELQDRNATPLHHGQPVPKDTIDGMYSIHRRPLYTEDYSWDRLRADSAFEASGQFPKYDARQRAAIRRILYSRNEQYNDIRKVVLDTLNSRYAREHLLCPLDTSEMHLVDTWKGK